MARIVQSHDPELSAFQSAIDEVAISKKSGGGAQSLGETIQSTQRPGVDDPMVRQAAFMTLSARQGGMQTLPQGPEGDGPGAEGIGDVVKYCATLAFNLAKAKFSGNAALAQSLSDQLNAKTGTCDKGYAEAAEKTLNYFNLQKGVIPYQDWLTLNDFVVDDGEVTLPADATVAVIGDWGTGQDQALRVLALLAEKKPNVVIHLGDVYYSGTDAEQQHYFFDNWVKLLGLTVDASRKVTSKSPATFALPGNHDMYTGGAPYYKMIQQLGHRASFFCLRNKDWQFIGVDTAFYDHGLGGPPTHLPPRQPEWLQDKMTNAGGRKTVLLSHHPLFSNYETYTGVDGKAGAVNPALLADVTPILKQVSLWLWGHQHQFVGYASDLVKGRCVGHGGYPVGLSEIGVSNKAIPEDAGIAGQQKGDSFWDNGYVILKLNGASATVTYYAVDENGDERESPAVETI